MDIFRTKTIGGNKACYISDMLNYANAKANEFGLEHDEAILLLFTAAAHMLQNIRFEVDDK